MQNIVILGAGAWGQALAHLATINGHKVHLWSRQNTIPLQDLLQNTQIILSAISMKGVREVASLVHSLHIPENTPENTIFVTATKGLEPHTTYTPSQIWQNTFPDHSVVVLSGPNLSKEIENKLPAATVVASKSSAAAQQVQ